MSTTNENTNSETTTTTRLRLPTITNQLERRKRGIDRIRREGSCGFDDCKIIKMIKIVSNNNKGRPGFSGMQFMRALLLITLSMVLVADLSRFLRLQMAPSRTLDQLGAGSSLTSPAWASWIGEVPTAAEMYGEGSADMPTTEAFDDDEEEPDEELDASASNEYPENENDNENDESYEDQDENPDGAESRRKERWLPASASLPAVSKQQRPQVWRRHNERRNKRDLEDRMVLASRRAERSNRKRDKNAPSDDDEFNVEDGDEDAWVHDGVDDIHIDPETKKAASELSYDERSIDAEYEPSENQKEPPVLNRTRVTTITDVIPITDDTDGSAGERDSTKVDWRFLPPPPPTRAVLEVPTSAAAYLPASYLTIDQAQKLIGQQHERLERQERLLQNQERQLAALSSEPAATWTATATARASAQIEPSQVDRRRQLSGV